MGNLKKNKDGGYSEVLSSAHILSTEFLAKSSIIACISTVLSTISTNLWFAPTFYKMEISDSIILLGGFALGPIAVAYMQLMKILLSFFINGTATAGVGELASFFMGISFVVPASMIYKLKKDFRFAFLGSLIGALILCVVSGLLNYYFLIPAYSKGYGLPIEVLVGMGTSVNPNITDLNELILYATIPFNFFKAMVNTIIAMILYKFALPLIQNSKK